MRPRRHRLDAISGFRGVAATSFSGFRRWDFSGRAVRVRAAHGRVAHAVLETAMLALNPDPSRKIVPVPRRLAAPWARLRVERAHRSAHRGTGFDGLGLEWSACELGLRAEGLAPTLCFDVDRGTDRPFSQSVHEIRDSAEGPTAKGGQDIADLEACGLRGRPGGDFREEHALAARDAVVRSDASVHVVPRDP